MTALWLYACIDDSTHGYPRRNVTDSWAHGWVPSPDVAIGPEGQARTDTAPFIFWLRNTCFLLRKITGPRSTGHPLGSLPFLFWPVSKMTTRTADLVIMIMITIYLCLVWVSACSEGAKFWEVPPTDMALIQQVLTMEAAICLWKGSTFHGPSTGVPPILCWPSWAVNAAEDFVKTAPLAV